MTKTIYGVRKCKECQGICHEGSYRQRYGERKDYYCSACANRKFSEHSGNKSYYLDIYEKIDVITD